MLSLPFRPRLLVTGIVIAGCAAPAVFLASGGSASAGGGPGISSIPGMSEVMSNSPTLCSGSMGTSTAGYCSGAGGDQVSFEGWVSNAAVTAYGPLNGGLPLPVPLAFAQAHPGPVEAFVSVVNAGSQDEANRLLDDPDFIGSWDPNYTPLPADALNGGVAFRIDSLSNDGLSEYRFAWVGETSVVEVNVLGTDMSVSAAQAVASRAEPS
jgi:hypothetical protein